MREKNRSETAKNWILSILGLAIVFFMGILVLTTLGLLPSIPGVSAPEVTPTQTPMAIAAPSVTPTLTVVPPTPLPPTADKPDLIPTTIPSKTPENIPSPTSTVAGPLQTAVPVLLVQPGSPRYLPAFTHTDLGCAWVGLAGQVFDSTGSGVDDSLVIVSATLDGQPLEWMALSGSVLDYGPGGYEIQLANSTKNAGHPLSVQVFNLEGEPLTEPFFFSMPQDCAYNLVLVHFQEVNQTPQ
jgi:hypothetical protein